ncbi:transporter substrate-binding domain-containing protein [Shimia sp. R11_0]|uniref:Bacterial extracellular solute-binding proteins, family 3 n=1 Tax=Shimia marina TaxID=321267 RepID=A0A0P1EUJ6_9RHOB|nr:MULTISPECIES: transporter substrate-binding domain-containing protein [Shimia]MBO9478328.1 transporter substrate-binding domain-containing protein [Shimia sp. R11_0]CUH54313.1 Bacterial extracellular solute-binding proteins, family 3 [Shimia marina]SFE00241.1 polar amino acid transport system substrate-binding protein [Shimia marina]
MKLTSMMAAVALSVSTWGSAQAETITFAAGEWAPYIGAELPNNGLHSERVREVMKAAGYDIALEYMPWKRSFELTKKGDYVATFSWSRTDERLADFHYPEVAVDDQTDVIFYSKSKYPDGLNVASIDDIQAQGLSVIGYSGYWYEAEYNKRGMEMRTVTTPESAWKLLNSGRVDVLIENRVVGELSVQEVLGDAAGDIAVAAEVRAAPVYVLFSKAHPDGAAMRDAWDAHAK